jgi:hypothetical protein
MPPTVIRDDMTISLKLFSCGIFRLKEKKIAGANSRKTNHPANAGKELTMKEQLNLSKIVSDFIAGRKEASHD